MNDLALHIEYLLLRHDCVVVPGLGAFLTHREDARFDAQTSMILPPSRQLGFNADVRLNDGLLAQSVARKEHIDMESASRRIASTVDAFVRSLERCGEAEVGALGRMSMHEGTILFVPNVRTTVDLECRGLHAFRLEPLPAERPMEVHAAAEEDSEAHDAPRIPGWLKVAASVMVLFMALGVLIATTDVTVNQRAAQAGLDSGLRKSIEYAVPAVEDTLSLSRQIDLIIAAPKADVSAVSQPVEVRTSADTPARMRYLLVVGSFPSLSKARKFIGSDSKLNVAEMDGNFRVYAAQTRTLSEANAAAHALRGEFPSVWVCRK